jgi:putative ABC transport system permease protein
MTFVAFKILLHDRAKYVALVLGISFATLLISQQSAIFHSLMHASTREILEANQADIWVMKSSVETLDQGYPIAELTVNRVRSVPGVEWAVPYYLSASQLRTEDGRMKMVQLVGIDDLSMVGAHQQMLVGDVEDLRQPDAIIMDIAGYANVFPGAPPSVGTVVEIGQRRAVIVGLCYIGTSWSGLPRVYTRRSLGVEMARETLNPVTYVLARSTSGQSPKEVANQIAQSTGMKARTRADFMDDTRIWILKYSGIAENFGITIMMGVIIGVAIVGQTFYMFSVENLKQFATLKAIGVSNWSILQMIMTQALFVSVIGFCLGIGTANLFFAMSSTQLSGGLRGMFMHPFIFLGSGVFIVLVTMLACVISVRKVLTVDPAIVFRG